MVKLLASKAVMVCVLMLFPVGCGGGDESEDAQPTTSSTTTTEATGPVPVTAESLVGKWKRVGALMVAQLRANGTFAIDGRGDLEAPDAAGKYTLQGDQVRFTASAASLTCAEGETWVWKATIHDLTREDYLYARYVKVGCGVAAGERWTFTRIG